jgi:hypothetical protein
LEFSDAGVDGEVGEGGDPFGDEHLGGVAEPPAGELEP